MPSITLLRHGQASFGAADYDALSDLGRQQAAVAGSTLAGRGLRDPLVVCGTLSRQRDTGAIVMAEMGLGGTPVVDGRWDEYDIDRLVAAYATSATTRVPAAPAAPGDGVAGAVAPPDSRTFQVALDEALQRWVEADEPDGWRAFAGGAVEAVGELAGELEGRDAVVSTSGGIIAAVSAHLLGGGVPTVVALNRVVVNASLTTLLVGRSGMNLLSFNDHAHLTGERAAIRTYR